MVEDHEGTRVAHMADAALLQYAGWSYGDYEEWNDTDDHDKELITEEEWNEAEKFGNFVHDAVARWIADVEKEVKDDVAREGDTVQGTPTL